MKRGLYFSIAVAFSTAVFAQTQNPPAPPPSSQPAGTISGFSSGAVSGFTPNAVSGFTPNVARGFSPNPVGGFTPMPRSTFEPGTLTPLTTSVGGLGTNNFLATPRDPRVFAPDPALPPLPQPNLRPPLGNNTNTNGAFFTPLF